MKRYRERVDGIGVEESPSGNLVLLSDVERRIASLERVRKAAVEYLNRCSGERGWTELCEALDAYNAEYGEP